MEKDSRFRQVDVGSSQRDSGFTWEVSGFGKQDAGFNKKDTESRIETGAVNLIQSHRNQAKRQQANERERKGDRWFIHGHYSRPGGAPIDSESSSNRRDRSERS